MRHYVFFLVCLVLMGTAGCVPGQNSETATPTVEHVVVLPTATGEVSPELTETMTPTITASTVSSPTVTPSPLPLMTEPPKQPHRILIVGLSCSGVRTTCDDAVFMDQGPQLYTILSDGTQLEEVSELTVGGRHAIRFSADGSRVAYTSDGSVLIAETGAFTPLLTITVPDDLVGLDFWPPSPDCLLLYRSPNVGVMLTVEKVCINQTEPEYINSATFPNLGPYSGFGFIQYHISPQGDALVVAGREPTVSSPKMFVWELYSAEPPRLIFSEQSLGEFQPVLYPVHWLPDGEHIEFLLWRQQQQTFYMIDRYGQDLTARLMLHDFPMYGSGGDWLPGGHEFAFKYGAPVAPTVSGLYILDMDSGEWRQILSEFYVDYVKVWPGS